MGKSVLRIILFVPISNSCVAIRRLGAKNQDHAQQRVCGVAQRNVPTADVLVRLDVITRKEKCAQIRGTSVDSSVIHARRINCVKSSSVTYPKKKKKKQRIMQEFQRKGRIQRV